MDRQTRVQKYKKLRDEISQMDTYKFENPYHVDETMDDDVGMSNEELMTEHIKKSTLSISIDQIVKAHDEYTTLVSQEKKNKKENETKKIQFKKLIFRLSFVLMAILLVVLVIFIVIILGGK